MSMVDVNLELIGNPSGSSYYGTSNRISYVPLDSSTDTQVLKSLGYDVNYEDKFSVEFNTPYLPMFFGLNLDPVVSYKLLSDKETFDFNKVEKDIGYQSSLLSEQQLLTCQELSKDTTVRNNYILSDKDRMYNPLSTIGVINTSETRDTNPFLEQLKTRSSIVLSVQAGRHTGLFSNIINQAMEKMLEAKGKYTLLPVDVNTYLKPLDNTLYIPTERFSLHYVNYNSYLNIAKPICKIIKDTVTIVRALDVSIEEKHKHVVTDIEVNLLRTPLVLEDKQDITNTYVTLDTKEDESYYGFSNREDDVDDVFKAFRYNSYRYTLDGHKDALFLSSRYAEVTGTIYCPTKDYELSLRDDLYVSINFLDDLRGNSNIVRDITNFLTLKRFNAPKEDKVKSYLGSIPEEPKIIKQVEVSKEMLEEVTRKYK